MTIMQIKRIEITGHPSGRIKRKIELYDVDSCKLHDKPVLINDFLNKILCLISDMNMYESAFSCTFLMTDTFL